MHRRASLPIAAVVVAVVVAVAACGNTAPSGSAAAPTPAPTASQSPTPEPTPTPVPTPVPTLPPLDVTIFGAGWTLVTRDTNVGENSGLRILSSIGPGFTVAGVCTGEGSLDVQLFGVGGDIKGQLALGQFSVPCPSAQPLVKAYELGDTDYHGVRITLVTTAPPGAEYIVLVGSHG